MFRNSYRPNSFHDVGYGHDRQVARDIDRYYDNEYDTSDHEVIAYDEYWKFTASVYWTGEEEGFKVIQGTVKIQWAPSAYVPVVKMILFENLKEKNQKKVIEIIETEANK